MKSWNRTYVAFPPSVLFFFPLQVVCKDSSLPNTGCRSHYQYLTEQFLYSSHSVVLSSGLGDFLLLGTTSVIPNVRSLVMGAGGTCDSLNQVWKGLHITTSR